MSVVGRAVDVVALRAHPVIVEQLAEVAAAVVGQQHHDDRVGRQIRAPRAARRPPPSRSIRRREGPPRGRAGASSRTTPGRRCGGSRRRRRGRRRPARSPRRRPRRRSRGPVRRSRSIRRDRRRRSCTAPAETSRRYLPAPVIVPPVPMPATKWVTRPSVSRQISGPGGLVVAARSVRVGVLVGLEGAGDLGDEAIRDGVVGARVLRLDGRRGDDDLGAVRAQHRSLVFRDLVGDDEDAPVAALLGDERQPDAGVAARRLDDRAAGLQQAVALGRVDDVAGDAVLGRSRRD